VLRCFAAYYIALCSLCYSVCSCEAASNCRGYETPWHGLDAQNYQSYRGPRLSSLVQPSSPHLIAACSPRLLCLGFLSCRWSALSGRLRLLSDSPPRVSVASSAPLRSIGFLWLIAASFDWFSLADRGGGVFSRRRCKVRHGAAALVDPLSPLWFTLLGCAMHGSCDRVASCQDAGSGVVLCLAMRALARLMRA
jgi:hypothetical protein